MKLLRGFLLLLLVLMCAHGACADVLTTILDDTFKIGEEKTIIVVPPNTVSAWNGTVHTSQNVSMHIEKTVPNKEIATDQNRFVLYGLNREPITEGGLILKCTPSTNDSMTVSIVDNVGADKDAELIEIEDLIVEMRSTFDYNNDGYVNGDDLINLVQQFLQDTNTNIDAVTFMELIQSILRE